MCVTAGEVGILFRRALKITAVVLPLFMRPLRLLAGICAATVIAAIFAPPLSKKKKEEIYRLK
jgi:hypothetical protein